MNPYRLDQDSPQRIHETLWELRDSIVNGQETSYTVSNGSGQDGRTNQCLPNPGLMVATPADIEVYKTTCLGDRNRSMMRVALEQSLPPPCASHIAGFREISEVSFTGILRD